MERLTQKTFYCWIIANLETIFSICCILAIALMEATTFDKLVSEAFVNWFLLPYGIIVVVVGIGGSVVVAKYTWDNFKEVVSRRMLWRSSNVRLFQKRLEYSASRFLAALLVFVLIFLLFLLLILWIF